jgi:putative tryptophan/tyrosine transport system substrate-binding protein
MLTVTTTAYQPPRVLAEEYRLPIIGPTRPYTEAGVLASYGVDVVDVFRIGATQIGQILKGASPGDMPIQQPTRLELVVNARAAKVLGLAIPQSILLRADEVIE